MNVSFSRTIRMTSYVKILDLQENEEGRTLGGLTNWLVKRSEMPKVPEKVVCRGVVCLAIVSDKQDREV